MDGQPAGTRLRLEHRVADTRGQEEPLARGQVLPSALDVENGSPGQDHDPLVLVLHVVLRPGGPPAQDLFDDQVAEAEDLLEPLALGRCVGGREQGAAAPGGRNVGLEGVVLPDDPSPAATAVIARADGANEEDDEQHEKQEFEHERNFPVPAPIEPRKQGFSPNGRG